MTSLDVVATANWLRSWDDLGEHRTGSAADGLTVEWLVEQSRLLGAQVDLQPFDIERLDQRAGSIDVGSGPIAGLPLFDAGRSLTLSGPIGPVGSDAPIGLVVAEPHGRTSSRLREIRATTRHRALVIVTAGGEPGLCPANAPDYPHQIGPPSLQVPSQYRESLEVAAAERCEAKFEVELDGRASTSVNVIARVGDTTSSSGPARLTVLTPRTSWWQSTGERGGGIVCWLEILRSAARVRPKESIRLIATAGHELGHLGLRELVSREPVERCQAPWLHLGANIGASGGRMTLRSPDASLLDRFSTALASHENVESQVSSDEPLSEAQLLHRRGVPYLSIVGTSRWFHNPGDRFPHSVDLHRLAGVAADVARTAISVAGAFEV